MNVPLQITVLPQIAAICKLPPGSAIPAWALSGTFYSVTATPDELSLVCLQAYVPAEGRTASGYNPDWRILKVAGILDFALTGILSGIAAPLAQAGISIFAISTYNTDYVLVKAGRLHEAVRVLLDCGYTISYREDE